MIVEALERATIKAWPAGLREEKFGWVLQATSGQSLRINAVWPLAWTAEVPPERAVDYAERWCRAHQITPCFKLAEGLASPCQLPDLLKARDYQPIKPTWVMTRTLVPGEFDENVSLANDPGEEFCAPMREDAPSRADYEERRGALIRTPAPRVFAVAHEHQRAASMGSSVVTDEIASIFVMRTAHWAQRHGLARRILRALLRWASEQGARTACLQVEAVNAPAISLYENEGFVRRYSYDYWRKAD